MGFAYFFISEYSNIIFMSFLITILFLGGWLPLFNFTIFFYFPPIFWLAIKSLSIIFSFVWIRAAFPRFRYDQLMTLTWRTFLPLSVATATFAIGFSFIF